MQLALTALALVLVGLTACAWTASSLNVCYICNSLVEPDCASSDLTVLSRFKTNCSTGRNVGPDFVFLQNAQVCWKQTQDVVGQSIIDRTCGPATSDKVTHCYDRVGTKKIKVTYCLCYGEACNSGRRLSSGGYLPGIGALTAILSFAALRR